MGRESKIEWTDSTFNPWWGCTKIAPGCTNCYAADLAKRYGKGWGDKAPRFKTSYSNWKQPLAWNRAAEAAGIRRRVFCASMADVFEDFDGPVMDFKGENLLWRHECDDCNHDPDGIPSYSVIQRTPDWRPVTLADMRQDLFNGLIDKTPWLDWLILTKRPENVRRMWCSHANTDGRPPSQLLRKNVRLYASASDQATYDAMASQLWNCRGLVPVLGWSLEPLIGPIKLWNEFDGHLTRNWSGCWNHVIVGGESGHNARPCHPQWVRDIRDQCAAAGVPMFFKQWGEYCPGDQNGASAGPGIELLDIDFDATVLTGTNKQSKDGRWAACYRVGKKAAGRMLDGVEHNEFPEVAVQ